MFQLYVLILNLKCRVREALSIPTDLVHRYPWLPSLKLYYSDIADKLPSEFISDIFSKADSKQISERVLLIFESAFNNLEYIPNPKDENLSIPVYILLNILVYALNNKLITNRIANLYSKNAYLTQIKQEITRIEKVASYVERMRRHIYLVEGRLDAKRRSINIFHEIHKLTPKEIYFTNINIEEEKKTILQGRAQEMSNVFSFVTTLENSTYFENVKTTYTTTKKDQGEEYTKFEIICMYEGEEGYEDEFVQ